jgi:predicted nucleic acid-binding Zn ribbon protein
MAEKNEYSLGEVLNEFVRRLGINEKLEQAGIMSSWEKVAGTMISNHTEHLEVRNRILYVKLDSAPLRNELLLARSKIVIALNRVAGRKVIDDIVFR